MAKPSDSIFYDTSYRKLDDDIEYLVDWGSSHLTAANRDKHLAVTRSYLRFLVSFARTYGLSATVLVNQFLHETGGGNSSYWLNERNPAGIGIWQGGVPSPFRIAHRSRSGMIAAAIHVMEMWLRSTIVGGEVYNSATRDELAKRSATDRWVKGSASYEAALQVSSTAVDYDYAHLKKVQELFKVNTQHRTHDLQSLQARFGNECAWACDPQYAEKLAGWITRCQRGWKPDEGSEPVSDEIDKDRVAFLLLSGHRQTVGGGGTPGEAARTPLLVAAYIKGLKDSGATTIWLQQNDGDSDPDDTVGGLDVTSQKALVKAQELINEGYFVVVLDLHFEGTAASVRGLFSIYPRSNGLTTGAPVGSQHLDAEGNNGWDKLFGQRLAAEIAKATGIPLRTTNVVAPGLMGEHQTGVGGQGYRLATFAYTAPVQPNAIRLVVEHGALTNTQDKAIIDGAGYYDKVALGVSAAVKKTFGKLYAADPPVPTEPKPVRGGSVPVFSRRVVMHNGSLWYPIDAILRTGPNGAGGRKNGGKDTAVEKQVEKGKDVHVEWLVRGQGQWFYTEKVSRLRYPVTDFETQYSVFQKVS